MCSNMWASPVSPIGSCTEPASTRVKKENTGASGRSQINTVRPFSNFLTVTRFSKEAMSWATTKVVSSRIATRNLIVGCFNRTSTAVGQCMKGRTLKLRGWRGGCQTAGSSQTPGTLPPGCGSHFHRIPGRPASDLANGSRVPPKPLLCGLPHIADCSFGSWQVRGRKRPLELCHPWFESACQRHNRCAVAHDTSVALAGNCGEGNIWVIPVLTIPGRNEEHKKISFAHCLQANISALDFDRCDFTVHDPSGPVPKHEPQVLTQLALEFPVGSTRRTAAPAGREQLSHKLKQESHR